MIETRNQRKHRIWFDQDSDAVFLAGPLRNIYFPFDIANDTPVKVATEMVGELDIKDWEPFEVADMIEAEISALVPHWKKWTAPNSDELHIFDYQKDYADHHYPFPSSSCSSSDVSLSGLIASHCMDERTCVTSLLQGMVIVISSYKMDQPLIF